MQELLLKRHTKAFKKGTLGALYLFPEIEKEGSEGAFLAHTLEDVVRLTRNEDDTISGQKIKGKTAIPAGRYEIVITHSNRFKKPLPLLLNVPQFEGIRIHAGNTDADTEGCILVGGEVNMQKEMILFSQKATNDLISLIAKILKKQKLYITIQDTD